MRRGLPPRRRQAAASPFPRPALAQIKPPPGPGAPTVGDAVELISAAAGSVEWENRVLREERATPFRRQAGLTLYMPPLPNSIISKLHTVSADTNTFKAGLEPGEARLRRSDWRSSRDDRAWASPNALV